MKTIGLVGGIGSGKSTAAAMLAEGGAAVLDADRAGHQVLEEPEVRRALVARWGEAILDARGQADRTQIAKRVFGESNAAVSERRFLESIVHPRIRIRLESEIQALPDAECPAAVIDAALLFEAGWDDICDLVLLVDCPAEIRQARALKRGWTPQEFAAREAAQMPIKKKKGLADHVVDNGGSLEALQQQVSDFWRRCVTSPAE